MRKRLTAWLAATVLAALLLYLLLLYAHTPSISDIRKTRGDEPAHLVAADGRLLAEYHWVHRQWVPLDKIAEPVIDALIATGLAAHAGLGHSHGSGSQAGWLHHHAATGT